MQIFKPYSTRLFVILLSLVVSGVIINAISMTKIAQAGLAFTSIPVRSEIRNMVSTVPVISMIKGTHKVTFMGMIHSAPTSFYEEANQVIKEAKSRGAIVLREGAGYTSVNLSTQLDEPYFDSSFPNKIIHQTELSTNDVNPKNTRLGGVTPNKDFYLDASKSEMRELISQHLLSLGYKTSEAKSISDLVQDTKHRTLYAYEGFSNLHLNVMGYILAHKKTKPKVSPKSEIDRLYELALNEDIQNTELNLQEASEIAKMMLKSHIYNPKITIDGRHSVIIPKLRNYVSSNTETFVVFGVSHISYFVEQLEKDGWTVSGESHIPYTKKLPFWNFWFLL